MTTLLALFRRPEGGPDALVSVTEEGGSYLASLVIGVDHAG